MGPLATAQQLEDALRGLAELEQGARIVHGGRQRIDGVGAPEGKGFFLPPTLLRSDDARSAGPVHEREVFGPVATLLPYDGMRASAAEVVALGGGTLVTSVYSDDAGWIGDFLARAGQLDRPRLHRLRRHGRASPRAREPPCRRPSTADPAGRVEARSWAGSWE